MKSSFRTALKTGRRRQKTETFKYQLYHLSVITLFRGGKMTINEVVQKENKSLKVKPVDFVPLYGVKTFHQRNSQALEYFYSLPSKERLKNLGMDAYHFITGVTIAIYAAGAFLNGIENLFNK
jgi:hypothetical protein